MSYDVLFIASESVHGTYFNPDDFAGLTEKYDLTDEDVRRLVFALSPQWTESGIDMTYPVVEHFFMNGRRFAAPRAEVESYQARNREMACPRYNNGIYIADYLIRNGREVELVNSLDLERPRFERHLARGPRIVALSSTFTPNRSRLEAVARSIKALNPEVTICVGGPLVHYSKMILDQAPEMLADPRLSKMFFFSAADPEPAIDFLVIEGRGEKSLSDAAARIAEGRSWKDLPNLAYLNGRREWIFTHRVKEDMKIDEERIQWDRLDEKYLGHTVSVRSTRGCPFRCKFCSFVVLHPRWEAKRVENLRDELRKVAARKDVVKHVWFADDNLFSTKEHVDRYTAMMKEEAFPFTWSSFVRSDAIDESNIKSLRDSGCMTLIFGVESGSPRILKAMGKKQRPDRVAEVIHLANDQGMSTFSTAIVGFPGETDETVQQTIDLFNSYPDSSTLPNGYDLWVLTVFPLTSLDVNRKQWGLKGHLFDWEHDTMNVAEAFRKCQKIYEEVSQGAYVLPGSGEDLSVFQKRGPAGQAAMRRFLKLRQRIACIDTFERPRSDGLAREAALGEIEKIVREYSAPPD